VPQERGHTHRGRVTTVTGTDHPLRPVLPSYTGPCRQRWLVLHGWAQGAPYWAPLARQLAGHGIMLICPDMPELARSCQAPPGSLERFIEMTELLAEHCGPDGVPVVVGHSAGGPLAVLLAHRLPALARLVLVEPLPYNLGIPGAVAPPDGSVVTGESVTDRLRSRYPFANNDTLCTVAAELTDAGAEPDIPNSKDFRRDQAVYAALRTLPVPLLVVRGTRSAMLSDEGACAVVNCAPSASEHVVPDAGHSVHLDQPRAVARLFAALMTEEANASTSAGHHAVRSSG
jgi:pimeloyl-ACP methyl ester carboxylesterase